MIVLTVERRCCGPGEQPLKKCSFRVAADALQQPVWFAVPEQVPPLYVFKEFGRVFQPFLGENSCSAKLRKLPRAALFRPADVEQQACCLIRYFAFQALADRRREPGRIAEIRRLAEKGVLRETSGGCCELPGPVGRPVCRC
jgi:hypothetical protein